MVRRPGFEPGISGVAGKNSLVSSGLNNNVFSTLKAEGLGNNWLKKPEPHQFFNWLSARVSPVTLEEYKRYFEKIPQTFGIKELLESREKTKWYRYTYSKIIEYLWMIGKIGFEDKERIRALLRVPGSSSKKISSIKVNPFDFKRTIEYLSSQRPEIALVYEVMYYSGARLEEAVHLIRNVHEKPIVKLEGAVRVIMNHNRGSKRCDFLYIPENLYEKIIYNNWKMPNPKAITTYIRKKKLLLPKLVRKLHMQLMKQIGIDYEIRNFIQNRVSKLSVGERHYEALLSDTDRVYPRIVRELGRFLIKESINPPVNKSK